MKLRQKEKDNLRELMKRIRNNKLYLGVNIYENKYPQLIVTNIDPLENPGIEAFCFFVFPFIIPTYSNDISNTPQGIVRLKIQSYSEKMSGISDSMMNRISSKLEENIKVLKSLS